jgi:hypothetical protein
LELSRWLSGQIGQDEITFVLLPGLKPAQKIQSPALFNLKEDIGETKNVIEQYRELAARLADVLEEHLISLKATR